MINAILKKYFGKIPSRKRASTEYGDLAARLNILFETETGRILLYENKEKAQKAIDRIGLRMELYYFNRYHISSKAKSPYIFYMIDGGLKYNPKEAIQFLENHKEEIIEILTEEREGCESKKSKEWFDHTEAGKWLEEHVDAARRKELADGLLAITWRYVNVSRGRIPAIAHMIDMGLYHEFTRADIIKFLENSDNQNKIKALPEEDKSKIRKYIEKYVLNEEEKGRIQGLVSALAAQA